MAFLYVKMNTIGMNQRVNSHLSVSRTTTPAPPPTSPHTTRHLSPQIPKYIDLVTDTHALPTLGGWCWTDNL